MKFSYSHLLRNVVFLLVIWILASQAWAQADVQGQWSTLPYLMPINPIHTALLNNGRVLVVSGSGNVAGNTNFRAGLWDPSAGSISTQAVSWDMFCNGMVVLPDGRPFINGGTLAYDPFLGSQRSSVYDPSTNTFTDVQNMAHGRWYPSVVTLADGRVMTFGGLNESNSGTNTAVEIYTPGSGWSTQYTASFTPPYYPWLHLLPSGNVFYSGATNTSFLFNVSSKTWTQLASTNYGGTRSYGSSVLLPLTPANNYRPKVMILGGGSPSTATTEIIDLGSGSPAWQWGPDMSQPRIEMNAVILPNQQVLALGGSYNDEDLNTASLNADIYTPSINTFTSGSVLSYARLYHSVALLMPDATVWVAGGNPQRGTYEQHMEIYKPAYLFTRNVNGQVVAATRPTISGAPGTISLGGNFTVTTPDAANISSVVLVRPGATTHAFNMDQRLVGLSFTASSGSLTVTGPPSNNIAPPGYYMLFILNSAGVPSVARFVQLSQSAAPADYTLTATPGTQSTVVGGSVSYSATVAALNGFSGSVGLTVSGLPSGATASFAPTSVSGSGSSTLTVNTASSTPVGSYTLTITGTSGSLTHTATVTLGVTAAGSSGSLTGGFATPSGTQNLSTLGTSDWAHWGLSTAASFDHKSGVTSQISNFTVVGSGTALRYNDNAFGFTWTGGTPTATATNTTTAVYMSGLNNGFRITVPADTTQRTLTIYVDAYNANAQVAAHLSDGSSPDYVDTSLTSIDATVQRIYALTYRAGSAGQTLTFNITCLQINGGDGNVALEAATLLAWGTSSNFVVSAAPATQTIVPGDVATYATSVSAGSNFADPVTLTVTGLPAGASAAFDPSTLNGTGSSRLTVTTGSSLAPGSYTLTIKGTSGSITNTTNVTLQVNGPPDFVLSISPPAESVIAGGTVNFSVTVEAQNDFSDSVGLNVVGLEAGETAGFNPNSITGSGTTTLTVSTDGNMAAGIYNLTVVGSSGTLSHQAVTLLTVSSPSPGHPAPTVSLVSPNSGPATSSQRITITGTNFVSGAKVFLGGADATDVSVVNSTTIMATTPAWASPHSRVVAHDTDTSSAISKIQLSPAHKPVRTMIASVSSPNQTANTVSVLVVNPDGQSGLVQNGYTYTATFAASSAVSAASTTGLASQQSPLFTFFAPAAITEEPGLVSVPSPDAAGPTLELNSVFPSKGKREGGSKITIKGTGFYPGLIVTFGDVSAKNVNVINQRTIVATTPPHSDGEVDVVVTNPDGYVVRLLNGFAFSEPANATNINTPGSKSQR